MRCSARAAVVIAAALVSIPASADAHGDDAAKYESIIGRTPSIPGLEVRVPGGGAHMVVRNSTGDLIVIEGYEGEPFARLLPDGRAQVNLRSPSYWLNKDEKGNAPIPASAGKDRPPRWETVGRKGSLDWHDHRIHWMGGDVPRQVEDRSRRTRVFDWTVPMVVGGEEVTIAGTLWWRGEGTGLPGGPFLAFGGLALAALLLVAVVLVRRKRGRQSP